MHEHLSILIISDDPHVVQRITSLLDKGMPGHDGTSSISSIPSLERLSLSSFQACILDLDTSTTFSTTTLKWLLIACPDLPVVAITNNKEACDAGTPVRLGAQDCLNKDVLTPEVVDRVVRFAVERHNSSSMLAASENRFKTLIEQNADGFVVVDKTGDIRFLNPAARRMLGTNGGRLTGTSFQYSLEPGCLTEIVIAAENKPPTHAEMKVVETQWQGENVYLASLRDITEGKKSKKELEKQLQRLTLLNHITRAIAERQDLESIFRVLLRYLEDELPVDFGQIWLNDAPQDTFSIVASGRSSLELAERLDIGEGTLLKKDTLGIGSITSDNPLHVPDCSSWQSPVMQGLASAGLRSVVALPLQAEERQLGILLVARRKGLAFSRGDIGFLNQLASHTALAFRQKQLFSDLHKTYEALRKTRTEVLRQERLRALGQMASGIVHDINNALSPIVGYTDMLLEDDHNKQGKSKRYLQTIRTAAGDMSAIINRMRDFYRKREHQEQLLPLDVNKIALQTIQLTRPRWKDLAQKQGSVIKVQSELADELPSVQGVESELREALTNLIFNAVDAMPHGGTLRVCTFSKQGDVVLELSDTGMGMDENIKTHCLEPFFSTKGDKGTGLGLAMVYGALQRHHGELEIESTPGTGTTVRIHLPARSRVNDRTPSESKRHTMPSLRVLCIDDESALRTLVQEMLRQDGHEVVTEESGTDGIETFRDSLDTDAPFDVVITDLGMPHISGRDVTREIKSLAPDTPVIMLTGWDHASNDEGGMHHKTDYTLEKPPTLRHLRKALRQVITAK